MKGLSTIVGEAMLVALAVIVALAVSVSIQSNVSSYVERSELANTLVVSHKNSSFINFLVFHNGGDPATLTGSACFIFENGSSTAPQLTILYNGESQTFNGSFKLDELFKFGDTLIVKVNCSSYDKGVLHLAISDLDSVLVDVEVAWP
ncbi:MAG: hypothetical protein DRJ33_07495 [Candidatus Methanomethylicota archaeon]|uniref:Archaeal Type IV pilin N-terminal domain-containing protein n=1 Tax=Thermoproteota archaeon TaxID=2056631 RepID=A0A497ETI8_9CREN|nr:MAG: hypothetical protein DRJ33_07495 [Candidatus Verstraetearchaeota archaeon]